jgi:protoheme IX farnesyltransferase
MEDGTRALPSVTIRPRTSFVRFRLELPPLPRLRMALGTLVVLFKLRVVALLVLASIGGAILASGGRLAVGDLLLLLVTGILSSAGASAANQYLERSQDARMERTCHRPLAAGQLTRPELALGVSVGLILLAVIIALPFNGSLALFLALGALIYMGVYTLWLKPRTLLNIVIGGAAGSCAVLSGSAAAGDWAHPTAVGLALLVFVWTPIHFWSLAQAYRDDYERAGVPMLPVLVGDRASARWIALHTGATAWITLLLGVDPALGSFYWLLTFPATLWLGFHSIRLIAVPDRTRALKLFQVSNVYLGLVLLAIYAGMLL